MPLVAVVHQGLRRSASTPSSTDVQEQFSDLSARVQENLAGVRVVRAYAQEEWEEEEFAHASTRSTWRATGG